MAKRPLSVLSLVSAVICVGSLLLVGRSLFRLDLVRVPVGRHDHLAFTADGILVLGHERKTGIGWRYDAMEANMFRPVLDHLREGLIATRWLGHGYATWPTIQGRFLILPLWLLPILTAILPVRWWRLRRRRGGRGFEVVPEGTKARRPQGAEADEGVTG